MITKYDICKILRLHEFAGFISSGEFVGSDDDIRDGFIHLSTRSQVVGTIQKHFHSDMDLYLVGLSAEELHPNLKWEKSRGGELFPHLYASLYRSVVKVVIPIPLVNHADFQCFAEQIADAQTHSSLFGKTQT